MKAIVYEQYGPPNVLELRDIAKPVLIVSLHLSVAQDGLGAQAVAFRFRSAVASPGCAYATAMTGRA
jgi:hypothetical protein